MGFSKTIGDHRLAPHNAAVKRSSDGSRPVERTGQLADALVIGGLSQLRPLARNRVRCLVVPNSSQDPICYSRYFKPSGLTLRDMLQDEGKFVASLVELSKRSHAEPVLFYGDDEVLNMICRHRERLAEYFRFEMPERDVVEACLDKTRFSVLATQLGLPVPRQILASPELDSHVIERELSFPCALKPDTHLGWFESEAVQAASNMPQKILLARNFAECEQALAGIRKFTDRFVVQEFISGGEEEIFSFHAYVPRQAASAAQPCYIGKKVRTYPSMGGESTLVHLVKHEEVTRLGWEIVRKLGIRGVVKMDFKRDVARDRFYLLEINLRYNLWNYLGAVCGVNLPLIAHLDNCGRSFETASSYRTDVKWLQFTGDIRSFVKDYYPSGQLTVSQWLRSYCGRKVYSMFAWDDPLPLVVHSLKTIRGALARKPPRESHGAHTAQPESNV